MKIMSLVLVCMFLFTSFVFADTLNTKTGLGYIKDEKDRIILKYELPIGTHPLKDGYSYQDVATRADLLKVKISEEAKKEEQAKELNMSIQEMEERAFEEALIQKELRAKAIEKLKLEGKVTHITE